MINFKGKKVLITGATGGIGGSLVKKFLSLNAESVFLNQQIIRVDTMLDVVNENVLKLSDNVVEM